MKFKRFHLRRCIWRSRLQKWGPSCLGFNVLNRVWGNKATAIVCLLNRHYILISIHDGQMGLWKGPKCSQPQSKNHYITEKIRWKSGINQDLRIYPGNKNIARYTAHTVVSWPTLMSSWGLLFTKRELHKITYMLRILYANTCYKLCIVKSSAHLKSKKTNIYNQTAIRLECQLSFSKYQFWNKN